jgi:hypothetical protein
MHVFYKRHSAKHRKDWLVISIRNGHMGTDFVCSDSSVNIQRGSDWQRAHCMLT